MTNLQLALLKFREAKSLSQEQLATLLQTSRSAIANWESGRSQPRPEQFKIISETLNCSTDYLLGGTNEPTPPKKKLSNIQVAFYNQSDKLTDELLEEVIKYMKYLETKGKEDGE